MPFNYKSPGVYVEELSTGARPIESAATAVLAMIGVCPETIQVEELGKGIVTKRTPSAPTLITNWTQFVNTYGDLDQAVPGGYLHGSMYGYFLNGGTAAYVVGIPVPVQVKQMDAVPQLPAGEGYLLNPAGQRTIRIATTGPLKQGDDISVEVQPPGEGAPDNSFNLAVRHGPGDPKIISNLTLTRGKGSRSVVDVPDQGNGQSAHGRNLGFARTARGAPSGEREQSQHGPGRTTRRAGNRTRSQDEGQRLLVRRQRT